VPCTERHTGSTESSKMRRILAANWQRTLGRTATTHPTTVPPHPPNPHEMIAKGGLQKFSYLSTGTPQRVSVLQAPCQLARSSLGKTLHSFSAKADEEGSAADGPGNLGPRRQTGDRGIAPDDTGRADRPGRPQLRADAYLAWLGEQARTSPDLLKPRSYDALNHGGG
jgi:hypothetical protein